MILLSLSDVQPGMVLGVGLRNKEGHILLGPGVVLTHQYLGRLQDLGYCAIWIDDEETRDIPIDDAITEATRIAATTAIRDTFSLTSRETEALRSLSVKDVRSSLENRRFQAVFQDNAVIERLSGHVEKVVGEVLDRAVLSGLSSLRTHNSYMYHHCLDVAVTATMVGRLLGWDLETLKKLAIGCILHDIGMIFLENDLLEVATPIGVEQMSRIKEHTVLGYLFMRDTLRVGILAAHVAYQHHERQDGSGYPRGLTGTNRIVEGAEVHLPGRIMPMGEVAAIADFYDACSSDRPYRRRHAPDQVWRMIRAAAGRQLNTEMVRRFLEVLPPYPLGTQVVVTSGRWKGHSGVVARLDPRAMHLPVIRLLRSPSGDRMSPVELDLKREETRIRGTVGTRDPIAADAKG